MGQEKLGIQDQGLVRAMASMGGGIASSGGPCGALTGGVALLGSIMGKEAPEKKDDPRMWKASYEFYQRFEKEVAATWGSINCRDITGVDWRNRLQTLTFRKKDRVTKCAGNTAMAARILGEVLEKYVKEGGQ